jgi:hypothetical protein
MKLSEPTGASAPDVEGLDWPTFIEGQLRLELTPADPASSRRARRIVACMRVVALAVAVVGAVTLDHLVSAHGLGLGLLGVWALPMVVLGALLGAEKLLVRITH